MNPIEEATTIQVRFVTKNEDLPALPANTLTVPLKLARYGLSEIVNHLLNIGKQ
jgi:hypothetical protein